MRKIPILGMLLLAAALPAAADPAPKLTYPIVDTGQVRAYDATREIPYPKAAKPFFGQDANYAGNPPRYEDHADGTVTDVVTRLMWQKDPGAKKTLAQARAGAAKCRTGGHTDWRLPTIKELYSLILFSGTDPDPKSSGGAGQQPFIDSKSFDFKYGDPTKGERIIDSQFATSTLYESTTMRGDKTMFGVNFADGRIKGYGVKHPRGRGEKTFYVLYVRGNPKYGQNDFKDNGDGTITDRATGLTWMQVDSGHLKAGPAKDGRMAWQRALAWAEGLTFAGKGDWRLPNAKELQSIVDYSRCPDTTKSAAIDPMFKATSIVNEAGKKDFAFYWTGTTHASLRGGETAVYVAFGRSQGWMRDRRSGGHELLDVHGAGSQRSDPKTGKASDFPHGRGPQGDVIRIQNFVRCVRGGVATPRTKGPELRNVADRPDAAGRPDGGGHGARFIRRLDRDGDGKVSPKEFDGPTQHFKSFDKNGDGYIDEDEAPVGPPPSERRGR